LCALRGQFRDSPTQTNSPDEGLGYSLSHYYENSRASVGASTDTTQQDSRWFTKNPSRLILGGFPGQSGRILPEHSSGAIKAEPGAHVVFAAVRIPFLSASRAGTVTLTDRSTDRRHAPAPLRFAEKRSGGAALPPSLSPSLWQPRLATTQSCPRDAGRARSASSEPGRSSVRAEPELRPPSHLQT